MAHVSVYEFYGSQNGYCLFVVYVQGFDHSKSNGNSPKTFCLNLFQVGTDLYVGMKISKKTIATLQQNDGRQGRLYIQNMLHIIRRMSLSVLGYFIHILNEFLRETFLLVDIKCNSLTTA